MQGATLEIGEVVDSRYRVISLIGRGGMGAVFEAQDVGTGARVALKVLVPEAAGEGIMLARFEREAQLAAKVDAAGGVVRVHSFGVHSGAPYFVMDFVEGRDLGAVFEAGPMEPVALARILESVARTVEACHAEGVVHRDLKPANVLVRADGRPLVADFGLAQGSATERLTRTGELLGSPQYMAPEQAHADGGVITAAADVYAMGAMLYHGLVGRPPFVGASVLALLAQVVSDDPAPPSRLGTVPAELEAVCLKALAKDPLHRYATAGEFADDLGRFTRGETVTARPTGWPARFRRRLARRERRAVAAVAGVIGLAVIVAAGGLYAYAIQGPRREALRELTAHADLSELGPLVGYARGAADGGEQGRRLVWVRDRIAVLEGLEPAHLGEAELAIRGSALEVLRAHERLLVELARLRANPGASAKVNSKERRVSPLERVVDGLVLEANGRGAQALERIEGVDDEAVEGVGELRQRLIAEIEGAVREAVRGAVRAKASALGKLESLARSVPAAALAEAKRNALESLADEWQRYMVEVHTDLRLITALEGIGAIAQSPPIVRPGPKLARAVNAGIDAVLNDLGASLELAWPDADEAKIRSLAIRAEATAYSRIDPQRTPSEKYLRFVFNGQYLTDNARLTLAAMRYRRPVRFRTPKLSEALLAKLSREYPWSRAVRYWSAAFLVEQAQKRLEAGRGSDFMPAVEQCRSVFADEPGLLDDLPETFVLYSWILLASALQSVATSEPPENRAPYYQQANVALEQVRGRFDDDFPYLADLAHAESAYHGFTDGFEAANAAWQRYLPLIRAQAEKLPPPGETDLKAVTEPQTHAYRRLAYARRDYGLFLLRWNKLELAAAEGERALKGIRMNVKNNVARDVRTFLAQVRNRQGDWKGALEAIEGALDEGLEKVSTTRETVRALVGLGDLKRAREVLEIGTRYHPEAPELLELDAKLKSLGH